ncbi:MAG: hypothetical protein FIA94_13815 [Nitrospirae bacterium]|nr:hypothetical protein [Nitrospirota bacterium]
MRRTAVSIVSISLACAAFAAYGQDKISGAGKGAASSDIRREASGTAGTADQRQDRERESYQEKAEEMLRRMDEKIKTLAASAERKGEKIKKEAAEKTREMQIKLKEESRVAREKLDELKAAGSGKWQNIKKDLDGMLGDLEKAYHRAVSKMESEKKQDH